MRFKIFFSTFIVSNVLVNAYIPILPLEFEFSLKEYTWFDLEPQIVPTNYTLNFKVSASRNFIR